MPLTIEIPDSHQPAAKLLYTGIAKQKWERLQAAKKEWEALLPVLQQLGIPVVRSISEDPATDQAAELNGYDTGWTWAKKASYILLKNGPLPAMAIAKILVDTYEPALDYISVCHSIPGTLSTDSRKGKFARVKWGESLIYDVVDREKAIQELNNST